MSKHLVVCSPPMSDINAVVDPHDTLVCVDPSRIGVLLVCMNFSWCLTSQVVALKGLLEGMADMRLRYSLAQGNRKEICSLRLQRHHTTLELSNICVRLACCGGICVTVEGRELCIYW